MPEHRDCQNCGWCLQFIFEYLIGSTYWVSECLYRCCRFAVVTNWWTTIPSNIYYSGGQSSTTLAKIFLNVTNILLDDQLRVEIQTWISFEFTISTSVRMRAQILVVIYAVAASVVAQVIADVHSDVRETLNACVPITSSVASLSAASACACTQTE